jgi:PAP2 superfamily
MRRFAFLILTAVLVTIPAAADMVTDWNAIASQAIVTNAGRPPGASIVDFVYVNAAMYDAVNSIDGRFQPYAVTAPSASPAASEEAAAATAAHRILETFFPSQSAYLDSQYAASLATVPDGYSKTEGIAVGEEAAQGLLAARAGDGRNDPSRVYVYGSGPGEYQRTPPSFASFQTPWIAFMKPFAMESPSQFRADPPPALDSDQWAADYNETKTFGELNSTARTPEQTEIGRFYTEHTGAQYNRILRNFALSQNLSLADDARLFAQVYVSVGDALIAVWDSKYFYRRWRPVTAIRAGDTDGNPDTDPDPAWTPLAVTPTHAEYPAAHGSFTGAFTQALEDFFGTKKLTITLTSTVTGTSRTFDRTDDLVKEIIVARIYGGMHFRTSVVEGKVMGTKAAKWVSKHYFQPAQ